MRGGYFGLIIVTGLATFLAGCQMEPGASGGVTPVAASGMNNPAHYAAVADNGFAVPAVPIDRVPEQFRRQLVSYDSDQPKGTIIIDPSTKHLYLITQKGRALRYGIAVGKAGFGWSGTADITGRTTWPRWIPPYEMIDRKPELEEFRDVGQPGGLTNPLGARALYLTTNGVDYGYRIHGTPEWQSIGKNASSGCIRMLNQDVMDLYTRVPDGTRVIVLKEDGSFPTRLTVPPIPKAKKPEAPEIPLPSDPIYGPI